MVLQAGEILHILTLEHKLDNKTGFIKISGKTENSSTDRKMSDKHKKYFQIYKNTNIRTKPDL
jgi:hypothetical protein